ncbi:hypothetical protein HK405_007064 [Cladochytrium tenue]|nr:hypothetical protein HK405_007064 [Cladochytrium tenue]
MGTVVTVSIPDGVVVGSASPAHTAEGDSGGVSAVGSSSGGSLPESASSEPPALEWAETPTFGGESPSAPATVVSDLAPSSPEDDDPDVVLARLVSMGFDADLASLALAESAVDRASADDDAGNVSSAAEAGTRRSLLEASLTWILDRLGDQGEGARGVVSQPSRGILKPSPPPTRASSSGPAGLVFDGEWFVRRTDQAASLFGSVFGKLKKTADNLTFQISASSAAAARKNAVETPPARSSSAVDPSFASHTQDGPPPEAQTRSKAAATLFTISDGNSSRESIAQVLGQSHESSKPAETGSHSRELSKLSKRVRFSFPDLSIDIPAVEDPDQAESAKPSEAPPESSASSDKRRPMLSITEDGRLDASSLCALCDGLSSAHCSVTRLNLSNNPEMFNFKDASAGYFRHDSTSALKDVLMHNIRLRELYICNSGLDSETAIAIAEAFPSIKNLQVLDIRGNPLDIAGVLALSVALRLNQTIITLEIVPLHSKTSATDSELAKLLNDISIYCQRNREIQRNPSSEQLHDDTDIIVAPPLSSSLRRSGSLSTLDSFASLENAAELLAASTRDADDDSGVQGRPSDLISVGQNIVKVLRDMLSFDLDQSQIVSDARRHQGKLQRAIADGAFASEDELAVALVLNDDMSAALEQAAACLVGTENASEVQQPNEAIIFDDGRRRGSLSPTDGPAPPLPDPATIDVAAAQQGKSSTRSPEKQKPVVTKVAGAPTTVDSGGDGVVAGFAPAIPSQQRLVKVDASAEGGGIGAGAGGVVQGASSAGDDGRPRMNGKLSLSSFESVPQDDEDDGEDDDVVAAGAAAQSRPALDAFMTELDDHMKEIDDFLNDSGGVPGSSAAASEKE